MTPVAKGARYRCLTGDLRGQEAIVVSVNGERSLMGLHEGGEFTVHTADLEAPHYQRLADAPAEVDPLFAEIAEAIKGLGIEGGTESDTLDTIQSLASPISSDEVADDDEWYAMHRQTFVNIVAHAVAEIRAIDRR